MTNVELVAQATTIWPKCTVIDSGMIFIKNISDEDQFHVTVDVNGDMCLNLGNRTIARTHYRELLRVSPEMRLPYLDSVIRNWDFYRDWVSLVINEIPFLSVKINGDKHYDLGTSLSVSLYLPIEYSREIRIHHYSPRCLIIGTKVCTIQTLRSTILSELDEIRDTISAKISDLTSQKSSYDTFRNELRW
jgi:hypothetical protein